MRRAMLAITALLLIAGRAQDAAAQCSISVLDMNGTPTLCSDYGDDWRWTGPNGFTSSSMCIDATVDGTYTLQVFDFATNTWSEPCSHTVGDPPTAPGCAIDGPDSVCAGMSVLWCAPSGNFTVAWSGPGGFSSSAACISVSEPGTYSLTVTDAATGMSSEPCSQTLRVVDCSPPAPIINCPAPARWWASVMGAEAGLTTARQSTIAGEVDERSGALDFGGTPQGLHELLLPKRHGRAWHAARRHYAAVLANIVADGYDVWDANGRRIGLSPSMTLDQVPGVPAGTTLASWVATTEATLLALDEHSSRSRGARDECRRIKLQAREINGGAHTSGCSGLNQSLLADDDDEEMDGFGDASLTTFGSGGGGGAGPFASGRGVRFTLERSEDVALDVIDLSGRRVKVLARGTFAAGSHERAWDGRSDSGELMRPGAYFVAGRIGGVLLAQRLILIR